jgi:hypothetical protein
LRQGLGYKLDLQLIWVNVMKYFIIILKLDLRVKKGKSLLNSINGYYNFENLGPKLTWLMTRVNVKDKNDYNYNFKTRLGLT